MGPVGLIVKTKNVAIDKVLPNMMNKKKKERNRKIEIKEIDGTMRMIVCHPGYINSELYIL